MGVLDDLLMVQQHDTAIDRLRHRRDTLPEREQLATLTAELTSLDAQLDERRGLHDEVSGEEKRLDDEAQSLEAKAADVERKMYSGEISSPRELQAMQAEVEQLRRQRRGLEDRELEVMERREGFDAGINELDKTRAALQADVDRLQGVVGDAESAIDAELHTEQAARVTAAATITPALLGIYDRCRKRGRGIGAARLVGFTCQGCHLSIPATEVDRIRKQPPDTVAHCDNCGCILVPS